MSGKRRKSIIFNGNEISIEKNFILSYGLKYQKKENNDLGGMNDGVK